MKFTSALLVLLSAVVVDAVSSWHATEATRIQSTLEDGDGACGNTITFNAVLGLAHDADGQLVKLTLPAAMTMKAGSLTVTTDYVLNGGALAADYTAAFDKATNVVTFTKVGTSNYLPAAALPIILKNVCVLTKEIIMTEAKIGNSKESSSEAVACSGANIAWAANTAGTLAIVNSPSTIGVTSTFDLKFTTAETAATTVVIQVLIKGFTVAASPGCKIGTTALTVAGGVFDSRYGYMVITGAASLWTASTEATIVCATGVTAPSAVQTVSAGGIIVNVGTAADIKEVSILSLPAVGTLAPTAAFSSAPTSAATSAFAFALCALVALFV